MLRHSKLHTRTQRARWIARRRKAFARWVGDTDWGPCDENGHHIHSLRGAPRPLFIRVAEFWTPARLGKFAKWNSSCNCWMCSMNRGPYERAKERRSIRSAVQENYECEE